MFSLFFPNLVAATAVVKRKNGSILLVKRSHTSKLYKHFWQLPEGKIKPFENPKKALLRELEEELGNNKYKLIYKYKHIYIRKLFNLIPYLKITRHVFEANNIKKIKLSHEHSEYKYFKPEEIKKNTPLLPGTRELLIKLRK